MCCLRKFCNFYQGPAPSLLLQQLIPFASLSCLIPSGGSSTPSWTWYYTEENIFSQVPLVSSYHMSKILNNALLVWNTQFTGSFFEFFYNWLVCSSCCLWNLKASILLLSSVTNVHTSAAYRNTGNTRVGMYQ